MKSVNQLVCVVTAKKKNICKGEKTKRGVRSGSIEFIDWEEVVYEVDAPIWWFIVEKNSDLIKIGFLPPPTHQCPCQREPLHSDDNHSDFLLSP